LREIRRDAGLTGRALGEIIGCHYTKVSRIEHGNQDATEHYIKALCRACRAEEHIPDLIASVRAIESMYLEWRRQTRAGMKRLMLSSVPLYERTRVFRIYEHNIVPGLFQTADYSAAMLSYFIDFLETPNDLEAAIEARMERQRVLYTGDRRFLVVIEERAIQAQVGSTDTMLGQLDRVLAVMSLQRVSLGIVPAAVQRTVFASVGFWIYEDAMVAVETPTASLEITQPEKYGSTRGCLSSCSDWRCTGLRHGRLCGGLWGRWGEGRVLNGDPVPSVQSGGYFDRVYGRKPPQTWIVQKITVPLANNWPGALS
jgi:transcriptional regulator with XRE-family HTH domain